MPFFQGQDSAIRHWKSTVVNGRETDTSYAILVGALEHFVVCCNFLGEASMPLVRESRLPAYKRIQDTIVKRLESGQLKPGDMVDSERELARIHGVSLMTARHALAGLEREGMPRTIGLNIRDEIFDRLVAALLQFPATNFCSDGLCRFRRNGRTEVDEVLSLASH